MMIYAYSYSMPCPFEVLQKKKGAPILPSGHKAASLCMEPLNPAFGSVEMCPSRTLQSKDGNHLVAKQWMIRNQTESHGSYIYIYIY